MTSSISFIAFNCLIVYIMELVCCCDIVITVRNSRCGKVMFLQACVKNSVHRVGDVCVWVGAWCTPPTETPLRQTPPPSYRQTPPLADTHPLQADTLLQAPPYQRDSHCSGWYASYWNAFLFNEKSLFLFYFRLAWVIIVVTAVILFTYQVAERTTDYFGYNTTVSVNIRYVAEVPFPAVTLCNINTFRLVCS